MGFLDDGCEVLQPMSLWRACGMHSLRRACASAVGGLAGPTKWIPYQLTGFETFDFNNKNWKVRFEGSYRNALTN